jgi:cytochrome subunit of sulfide dehydrogenase
MLDFNELNSRRRRLTAPDALENASNWLPWLLAMVLLLPVSAAAQDRATLAGRSAAASCASCHGADGASAGGIPSLAGRPQAEIVRVMQEFKNGKRQGTLMPQLAKGYTEEEIALLSAWFAQQRRAP